ncbi:glucose-6-phosphate isomerase [Rhodophyticola porphyridii]|uniref:Glucose-6-phosphate isomerase n=1 Tax=Rhodophyticola porphyridii TaxID=1852017 RepID=A0A3L9Y6A7_9RHOB|nr:glucose-6-phosphate isomerase [Roseicyclus sp.]MBO6623314.1 glucose-6-phosphate isomerase [Roseicyclus sp.]MBO6922161.1 glucose-6-phosphate isomerase [Roseicyclus sp.]RMA41873.1 glucose-6-phosphate isomerase [Rhodophyticola porphyridii]
MFISAILASTFALAGCQLSNQDRANLGLLGGAAGGVLLADALDANPEMTIVAGVAGAAAGTMIARSTQQNRCAYATGDGRSVYYAACP